MKRKNVLTIAGVDPSGGAGILADVKSISAFGGYALAVVAALTAQNTKGVTSVKSVDAQFIKEQLDSILDDIQIDSVKIGLLSSEAILEVSKWLKRAKELASSENRKLFVVHDPVMVATSNDRLLEKEAEVLLKDLASSVDLITPNLPELAVLTNSKEASTKEDAIIQAKALLKELEVPVFLKLGHLETKTNANDFIVYNNELGEIEVQEIEADWVETENTHGTGCSLSSSLAAVLPLLDGDLVETARIVKFWLTKGLSSGNNLLVGNKNSEDKRPSHGPIDHLNLVLPNDFFTTVNLLTEDIVDKIENMEFIRELIKGSLSKERFADYLIQDNIYVVAYSRVINEIANLTEDSDSKKFLESIAGVEVDNEIEFHNSWLNDNGFEVQGKNIQIDRISKQTKEYIDLLDESIAYSKTSNNCFPALAAILPCAYLYGEFGKALKKQTESLGIDLENHIYGVWIKAYSDSSYLEVVDKLVRITNDAAKKSDDATILKAIEFYRKAANLEFDFFDQV